MIDLPPNQLPQTISVSFLEKDVTKRRSWLDAVKILGLGTAIFTSFLSATAWPEQKKLSTREPYEGKGLPPQRILVSPRSDGSVPTASEERRLSGGEVMKVEIGTKNDTE